MIPKKQCNHPPCKVLVDYNQKYCEKHKAKQTSIKREERKQSEGKYFQFYQSRTWRKASYLYRLNHPVCEDCLEEGLIRKADVVDHKIELKDDWSKRLDESNFRSLCHTHHNIKTTREKRKRES